MNVCCYRFVICRCRNSSHLIVCIIEVPIYFIHGSCSKCFPLLGDGVIESTVYPFFLLQLCALLRGQYCCVGLLICVCLLQDVQYNNYFQVDIE